MKNLPCNRCPLFPDEPGQNVLASSTCFETGHELRESIYKHCTRLQNKAKKGTLLYHCGGSILSSSPSILLSEIHSTVLGFNSNWRLSGQNQDTQEEEKEILCAHSKTVRGRKEPYYEALKNMKRSLQLDFQNQLGHYNGQ